VLHVRQLKCATCKTLKPETDRPIDKRETKGTPKKPSTELKGHKKNIIYYISNEIKQKRHTKTTRTGQIKKET